MTSNLDYLQTLNVKKCVLEVQTVILEKLTIEENRLKRFSDVLDVELIQTSFSKRIKEIEKTLLILKY